MNGLRGKSLHQPRIIALSDDQDVTSALARLVDGVYPATAEVLPQLTSPEELADWHPDLIIVSLDDAEDAETRIRDLKASCTSKVLAIGQTNDVKFYRRMIQAGAADYLLAPLDDTQLVDAIDQALAPEPEPVADISTDHPGIHVVIGARGGVGATTLAVSTAWLAADMLGKETALIDLDLHYGCCALALDLLPGSGLRDALANPDRIDSLFIGSAMINATDNLFLLGAEEALDRGLTVAPDAIDVLMDAVTQTFSCVVVDLPRTLVEPARPLLARADTVTIVSDLSIAGLRDAVRLQDLLSVVGAQNVQIAVRQTPKGQQQVSPKEMEQGLGRSVTFWLPHDEKSAISAATQGKAVCDVAGPRSPFTKAITAYAKDVAGIEDKPKRKKLWRW